MKKYIFLLKPILFIFNLLFATWLVFRIEKITPSDFGRYKSLFEDPVKLNPTQMYNKEFLKKTCNEFKSGILDSAELERRLERVVTLDRKDTIR